ncbi:MAG: hypothetical protein Q8O56_01895 [Solirubrobacteraceae bacterium]|nr:hypothetical protein [Solirubrobacteraceae bacterium]
MGYKMLGFVVWQGARWYTRRRVTQMLPSRRVAAAALVVSAVGTAAVVAVAKRDGASDCSST